MKLFEVKTDNSIFGVVAEDKVQAMGYVFENTEERFIHDTREVDEQEMKSRYIYDSELNEDFSLFDIVDFSSTESYLAYTNDSSLIE
jgi:hypothetical protein